MKLSEIVNSIIESERRNNVFEVKFKKKYSIWPFYRMYFYNKYMIYKGIREKSNTIYDRSLATNIRKFLKLLLNSNISRIFFSNKKYKYLIVSSQRNIKGEEMYTKDLKNIIDDQYIEFSMSQYFDFLKGPIYLDAFKVLFKLISWPLSLFIKPPLSIDNFMKDLNAPSYLKKDYVRYSIEYKLWFFLFNFILRKFKPKKIFFVSGVYYTPLIAAAEKNNILIYEIQHGLINKYHLAYHFPGEHRKGFFSNGLLLLSDFWKKMASYPEGTELITIGNNFFSKDQLQNKKIPKYIAFISENTIAHQLIKYIYANIDFFKTNQFRLAYKLHPQEYDEWRKNYKDLAVLAEKNQITVISDDQTINELLSQAEMVFGVTSTVIYEAIDCNCKTFILDLPGCEYFDELINLGIVKKINSSSKLRMEDLDFQMKTRIQFFSPTNFETLLNITRCK